MPLVPGAVVGSYEVLAALGAGGMGEVYRARDTRLKREVALKVLPEAFASDPERMARFQREAEMLAALNHPNIASIYGLDGGALVMELVEGETLSAPLPLEIALRLAKQMAEALEYAHERGVIHRDLKPANVKVTPEGVLKLLDFGLAKAIENPTAGGDDPARSPTLTLGVTKVGVILGTAAYMSPEQAAGGMADRRADVWSFGAVLYELLTGRRAFQGESVSDTLANVLKVEPDWAALPPSTPSSIRRLLARCLTKDRKQRLQAIGEARIAIQQALAGEPSEAATATPSPSRHGRLFWTAAGLAVAVAMAAGWWVAARFTQRADTTLVRFQVALDPGATAGGHITTAISPDGNRLAYPVRGADGKVHLATRVLDQAQSTMLAGTDGADDPFFSPDGQWIGFFAEGKLKKVAVRGGAVVVLCGAVAGRGASWGDDDNIVATLSGGSGIGLSKIPAAGGAPKPLTNPASRGEATHRWPQVLPGGDMVLFMGNKTISKYDNSDIELLYLKTGEIKVVQHGGYFGRYLPGGFLLFLRQGTLFGVKFDLKKGEVSGTPVPLLTDVAGDSNTAGGQFDFSRNGRVVYLSGKPVTGIWALSWLDSTGKSQPLLPPAIYYEPRLSPDGKRLAFSSGTDIEIYDIERETRTRLTSATQSVNNCPVWTHDGKHVVFMTEGASTSTLQWIRADGVGGAQTLLETKEGLCPYSLTPDDRTLAYSRDNAETRMDVWTLPLDLTDREHPRAGKAERFLGSPFLEADPAFSADGRWLAYSSDESGRTEVFVVPFPTGAASGRWQVSTAGGHYPIWSRNGHELFFESFEGQIMTTRYESKADQFSPEKPRSWSTLALFNSTGHLNMDTAADGKRFVVAMSPNFESSRGPAPSPPVIFLMNFFDEVQRRIPAK